MREYPEYKELQKLELEIISLLPKELISPVEEADTKILINNLQAEFDKLKDENLKFPLNNKVHFKKPSLLKQIVNQLNIYPKIYWIVSIIFFLILTKGAQSKMMFLENNTSVFGTIYPIFIFISILYSSRSWNKEMLLIEMIAPFPPALILLSRLIIILGLTIILGLLNTIFLYTTNKELSLVLMILSWLSPTILLFGIFLYIMFSKGIKVAYIVSLVTWITISIPTMVLGIFSLNILVESILYLSLGFIGSWLLYKSYKKSLEIYEIIV